MMIYVIGGLGITIPVVICMILGIWYKPALRRCCLALGCVWCANFLVPELETRMASVESFMAQQKLPRLMDVTPEISASDVSVNKNDVLGSGGYGAVYRGSFEGGKIAVKAMFETGMNNMMSTAAERMMRKEALILCSLNHPNIIRVFGTVPEKGWLVMELCEGGSLDELLRDHDVALDSREKARLAKETATGVAYLHMKDVSIVHGDMKAANVLLTKRRVVKLCDFGMAEAKNRSKTMTSAGAGRVALTVAWSAPELFKGKQKTFASDVYALGMTLWQIFERQEPFSAMPEAAIVNQCLSGVRPDISAATPATAKKLIAMSWAGNPSSRPRAAAVACALNQYHEGISRGKSGAGDTRTNAVHPMPDFGREYKQVQSVSAMNEGSIERAGEESRERLARQRSRMRREKSGKVQPVDGAREGDDQ